MGAGFHGNSLTFKCCSHYVRASDGERNLNHRDVILLKKKRLEFLKQKYHPVSYTKTKQSKLLKEHYDY